MIQASRSRRRSRAGAVAVVAALSLLPIIGVMALVVDVGLLMSERRKAQAAADAASFAAVSTYHRVALANDGRDPVAAAFAAAREYAAANGFLDDGDHATVLPSVVLPPARYAGADKCFQVVVTSLQPRLFSGIFGSGPMAASGRSLAVRIPSVDPSLIILNPRDQASLSVAGSARVIAEDGVIQVKSNHPKAVDVNNSGQMMGSAPRPARLEIAGDFQLASGGSINQKSSVAAVQESKTVKTGVDPAKIVDDLESTLARPNPAGLPARQSPPQYTWQSQPYQLNPGYYANGIILNSGGVKYVMNPGVYYINQGDFRVENGVPLRGENVFIYLKNGNVSIQGGYGNYPGDPATVYLTPPTSGPYKGASIFQDAPKNAVTGDYTPHTINMANGTYNKIGGLIYAPGATMALAGGATNRYGRRLIVNKLNVSNNAVVELPKPETSSHYTFRLAE